VPLRILAASALQHFVRRGLRFEGMDFPLKAQTAQQMAILASVCSYIKGNID
jgi:hypothetical protein